MLIRSRSARFAAIALAVTTPVVASFATPAFADGSDADVTATINEDGDVAVTSSKGLSRTTVVLCDGSIVVIPSWSGDATSGVVDVDGVVRAVFVHSGNNTTPEAIAFLESLSPGASNGESTGELAYDEPCDEDPDGDSDDDDDSGDDDDDSGDDDDDSGDDDDDSGDDDDDTTVTPTDTSGPGTTGGPSTNAPSSDVLGVTIEKASNPAPAPAPATSPAVDSNTLSAGGELPRTGASVQFLVTLALTLLAAGVTLRATFTRRIRSASSPG